jgi:hypothetical protein
MVPFRRYLYPLVRGYRELSQDILNHGSTRRDELSWRIRFGTVKEDFDLAAAWEEAMKEREHYRPERLRARPPG